MTDLHPPTGVGDALHTLATRGALSDTDLGEALGLADDSPELDELIDELEESVDRVVTLADERLADAVTLLAGVTCTHRLTAEEVAGGWVTLDDDLNHLSVLAEDSLPLPDGRRLELIAVTEPLGGIATRAFGPPGWLAGAAPGSLLGMRLADGAVHLSLDPDPLPPGVAATALAATAARRLEAVAEWEEEPRVELHEALWEALADQPDALSGVLPPLTELADAAGLNRHRGLVADPAHQWSDTPADVEGIILTRALYGLDPEQSDALQALRHACAEADAATMTPAQIEAAAEAFADAEVLEILLHERGEAGDDALRAVEVVARLVTDRHGGPARAGALAVLARVAERDGDPLTAEKLLTDALDADPGHGLALEDAASYAEDRGDARRAMALLSRAGWEPEELGHLRTRLASATRVGGARAGRNDPCPCGSGRKFKRCCAERDGGPLPARADWLAYKLASFLRRFDDPSRLRPILRARFPDGHGRRGLLDPLACDLALFDAGVLGEFLRRRGPLLPADEAALAASWGETRRSAYRVERQRGQRLALTDLRSGAEVTALAVEAPPLDLGTVLLARLVPSGGDEPLVFWVPIPLGEVTPSEAELAVLCDGGDPVLAAAALPVGRPVLRTTEGEPTLACDIRYRFDGDEDQAVDALAAVDALEDDEDEPGVLRELVEVGGMPRVRGTVTVGDGQVRIDTNAAVRADRLRDLVEQALGEAVTLLVDRRTPMWQAVADEQRFGPPPERHEPTPEEGAALEAFLREQEERWVDEPVPALGGLTPRQAVDDPVQRRNLEDLLDGAVGMFDYDRLRMLLGLAEGARPRLRAVDEVDDMDDAMDRLGDPYGDDPAVAERRGFAVPPASGRWLDLDLSLLNPADEDERLFLLEAEHPELADALEHDLDEVPGDDGEPMSPRLHLTLHEVVANQLWDGEPPEVWATAQRLLADGYDRHEILHMLAAANADELFEMQRDQRLFDHAGFVARLDALPGSSHPR